MHIGKIRGLDKEFKFPTKWEEITIKRYAEYEAMVKNLQKSFVKIFNLKDESEVGQITQAEIFRLYPTYFTSMFCFWTGLAQTDAFRVDSADIFACIAVMNDLLAKNTGERKIDRFDYLGETYLFPTSKKDINGNEALMSGESFGAMVFAFQQEKVLEDLKLGKFDVVANQIAILCRPEGEDYDPEKVNERAELFKGLSMEIVWQFVFFSIRQTSRFKMLTKIYTKEAEAKTS